MSEQMFYEQVMKEQEMSESVRRYECGLLVGSPAWKKMQAETRAPVTISSGRVSLYSDEFARKLQQDFRGNIKDLAKKYQLPVTTATRLLRRPV